MIVTIAAPATPTPEAVKDAADKAAPELDVASLLVTEDEAAPVDDAVGDEEAGDDTAEAGEEAQADDGAAKPAPADDKAKPAEGTPDKVLQQMQQTLAAANRKIDDLQAKVEAGEKLTPREKEQVKTEQRKLESVRAALAAKGKDIDLLDDGMAEAVAESLLEADKSIDEIRKELAATRADVAALKPAAEKAQAAELWDAHSQAYPGVAVKPVWDKALVDAMAMTGIDKATAAVNPALAGTLSNVASNLFHQRAANAAKSVSGKTPPEKAPQTARKAPPVTPGGARVTQSSGVIKTGQPSEDSEYMSAANALVVED